MRLLLHICCAPCLCRPLSLCRQDGIEVEGLFYNPNIHPFIEFRRRLKSVHVLAAREKLLVHCEESYGLAAFLQSVSGGFPARCRQCYRMRLARVAQEAKERGCDAFSSTLLASPTQDHAALCDEGEQAGEAAGVKWFYRDWRPHYEESMAAARRQSLYRQQYCGCIWSEYERYRDSTQHVWRSMRP